VRLIVAGHGIHVTSIAAKKGLRDRDVDWPVFAETAVSSTIPLMKFVSHKADK
jgi:hypothetical protein